MNRRLIKKTIDLYKGTGWKKLFTRIRIWDAPFSEIERYVPDKGLILDLGCGEGIFTNYLALSSSRRKLVGIEIDESRVRDADRKLKNAKFIKGDVLTSNFPASDCILMTHLLHHLLSKIDQEKLIKKAFKGLKKGGVLIITEVDNKPFIKYIISWLTDAFVVPILFEKQLFNFAFFYRKSTNWITLLRESGFKVKTIGAHKGKPFSHLILLCKKT